MEAPASNTQKLLRAILKPVVGLCLKRAIVITEVLEALKAEFAEQASAEIRKQGAKVTFSKVSAMTALTRREVKRLSLGESPAVEQQSLGARILAEWETNKRYLNKKGAPRPLYLSRNRSDFRELVESISQDTDSSTMLFELERLGLVVRGEDGSIILKKTEVPYQELPDKALNLLFRNIESMMDAAEENLGKAHESKNHFIRTEYYDLDPSKLAVIRAWLLKEGASYHKKVRAFLAKYDRTLHSDLESGKGCRVVFSSFSHAQLEDKDARGV